jgi:hypothetical protein
MTSYNKIDIQGYNYKDLVCLNKKVDTSCVTKQLFFSIIEEATAIPDYDGVLGISKGSEFFQNLLDTHHYANIFTVHIGKDGAKSHLTFGGFNPAYMAAPNTPPNYY